MRGYFRRDRAVIVVNSLLVNAGVERRTLDFAQFLMRKGVRTEVCVLREAGEIAALYQAAGITVRLIRVYGYEDGAGTYSFSPAGFLRLAGHFFKERFGLIFCAQPPSYIFGRMAALPTFGRRLVAMERFLVEGRSRRRAQVDRWLARWSRVVCVSTLLREQLAAESGIPLERIRVVEDGVTIAPIFEEQTALRARLKGRFVFGCVGLLCARKRQALLIRALAMLLMKQTPALPATLVLVGTGEEEGKLKALAAELGLAEEVIFAGEQAHVHDFYPLFDAFVFPSVGEGLGNVWAEAMLHGLPVICADVRPMKDYIRHGETGLLAPADDAEALAGEMARLMNSPELRGRLGENGRRLAQERFDGTRQMERLLDAALR